MTMQEGKNQEVLAQKNDSSEVVSPEIIDHQNTKMAEKAPMAAEASVVENFQDQQTAAPTPTIASTSDDDAGQTAKLDVSDDYDDGTVPPIDRSWVSAVENIIEKDKGAPFEEERDAEKLSVKYLWQRFKKKVKIDKD